MNTRKRSRFHTQARHLGVTLTALVFLTIPRDAAAQRAGAAEVLTNQSVMAMTTAKLDRGLLLSKVNTTRNSFDVTVNGLVGLTQANVHQEVMLRMITMAADPKLGQPPSKTPEVLDNQSIITLVGGKVPKGVILAKIQNTKATFDTSSSGLVNLTQGKVPADVIKAMVAKTGGDD